MITDQVQTFVGRGPSESFVKRCERRRVSFCQFQIDGVVERQTVFLGQGECDVHIRFHIGTNGQVMAARVSARGRRAFSLDSSWVSVDRSMPARRANSARLTPRRSSASVSRMRNVSVAVRLSNTIDPTQVIAASQEQLGYSRLPDTDMEVCCAAQVIEEFARGEGIWRGLQRAARTRQLDTMIRLVEELYPTFRWYLYDGLTCFSVPLTIFGPLRAAVYMGQMYFVYTTSEHIRVLTRHFDGLIRVASVQPPDVVTFLRDLRRKV